MIKENKMKIFLALSVLFLLTSWFYWFEWRPTKIRKVCSSEATKDRKGINVSNLRYSECIVKKGLKPEILFEEKKAENVVEKIDTSELDARISDLKSSLEDSIEEQNRKVEDEFQDQANCESNGGRYQGDGLCIYY